MSAPSDLNQLVGGGSCAYGDATSTSYMLLKGGKKAPAKKAAAKKAAPKKAPAKKTATKKKGGEAPPIPPSEVQGGAGSCAYADVKGGKKKKGGNTDPLGDLSKLMPSSLSNLFNDMGSTVAQAPPTTMGGGKKGGSFEVAPFAAALTLLAVRAVNDKQFTEKVKSVASRLTGQEAKKKRKNKRKSQKKPVM